MIYIRKAGVPKVFSDIKREYGNYDELRETSKNALKEYLIREQGWICAYCMTRISLSNSTIEHYTPRNGDFGDMSKSLDYDNLFAVCLNARNSGNGSRHCDVSKGDKLISVDPRKKSDISQIKYRRDGEIYSENADFNDDLNDTLNLNILTLKNNRKAALDTALNSLSKLKDNSWGKDFVRKTIDRLENSDEKTEYIGIIVYYLSKRMNRSK